MPRTKSYIEKLTKRDQGRRVETPSGEEWIIRGIAKRTEHGRRKYVVGLQHADEPGRYQEISRDSLLNRNWTWGDQGRAPSHARAASGSRPSSSREVKRDDEGRRLCRRCEEPIFFIEMPSGKAMPVDHGGKAARRIIEEMAPITMDRPTGWVLRSGKVLTTHELQKAAQADLTVYRSHFASCNQYDQ